MKLFQPGWMSKNRETAIDCVKKQKSDQQLLRAALESSWGDAQRTALERMTQDETLAQFLQSQQNPKQQLSLRALAAQRIQNASLLLPFQEDPSTTVRYLACKRNGNAEAALAAIRAKSDSAWGDERELISLLPELSQEDALQLAKTTVQKQFGKALFAKLSPAQSIALLREGTGYVGPVAAFDWWRDRADRDSLLALAHTAACESVRIRALNEVRELTADEALSFQKDETLFKRAATKLFAETDGGGDLDESALLIFAMDCADADVSASAARRLSDPAHFDAWAAAHPTKLEQSDVSRIVSPEVIMQLVDGDRSRYREGVSAALLQAITERVHDQQLLHHWLAAYAGGGKSYSTETRDAVIGNLTDAALIFELYMHENTNRFQAELCRRLATLAKEEPLRSEYLAKAKEKLVGAYDESGHGIDSRALELLAALSGTDTAHAAIEYGGTAYIKRLLALVRACHANYEFYAVNRLLKSVYHAAPDAHAGIQALAGKSYKKHDDDTDAHCHTHDDDYSEVVFELS